ncbi:collagenase [Pseudoalteromonas sp. T1lg65]|uniref:collagenase n=1 Tax=Pseudoalteromonas sp. T1lg65 TaxID=2077101 RepID=UPI003F7ADD18
MKYAILTSTLLACAATPIFAKGKPTPETTLPYHHTCSDTLRFQAQDMTTVQFSDSCSLVGAEETYFHQKLETAWQPVNNDLNDNLLMVIFDDYRNYSRYGSRFYGINTNNGGMYIEGNATDPNNQATFYAHEADWLRPEFAIWNLEHEYVHYLDGRFNLKGNFGDYPQNTVWWSEGLAEYISLKSNNEAAISLINPNGSNLSLASVLNTNYSDSTDQIYRWGYLGVRFMFERHQDDVMTLRNATREADWSTYQSQLTYWANRYESEWQAWLAEVARN